MAHTPRTNRARRTIAGLAAAAAIGALAVTGIAAAAPESTGPSGDVLAERMRGEQAIEALSDRLPAVAAMNEMTPAEFQAHLRSQDQLWVSPSGRLLYVDEGLQADEADHAEVEAPAESTSDPSYATYTTSEAFQLHSRPGSQRVIYLDFDGHANPGSGWSGTPGAPYDTGGSPSSFSDAERRVIIDVWRQVSEDFAPFDVDVTTQDPGVESIRRTSSTDMQYGTRVVITPTKTDCSSCGGIAYINNYATYGGSEGAWTHDKYQPAWVYVAGTSAKNTAEAASHEAGHTLGLHHDGTSTTGYYQGHGSWAPIMGTGYSNAVTQWSKGEYSGANQTEDDVAMIAARTGVPTDDHGDAASAATPLSGSSFSLYGLISTRTDVDAFAITHGGGTATIDAKPAPLGPNLDIALSVLDSSGRVVGSANPSGLAANLQLSLTAGTYTVLVDGVGAGSPSTDGYSDYGSLGRYVLSGTLGSGGATVTTNQPPTVTASASTTSGPAPLSVSFTGSGSDADGSIASYRWDFGDGTSATTASASKTFQSAGTYSVRLTVTDDKGAEATSSPITISVSSVSLAAPSTPNLAAPTVSSGKVGLTWSTSDRATSYAVYRETRQRNGSWKRILVATVSGTSFTDSPSSGTHLYQVEARNSGGAAGSNKQQVTIGSTSTKTTGKGSGKRASSNA